MKRKRSEILNKLADVIMELDDVREQLKQARETSSYWFERCKELEASENVQGVPFVAAPAGVPGGAGSLTIYAAGAGNQYSRMNIMIFAALWCVRIVSKNAAVFCKERQYG